MTPTVVNVPPGDELVGKFVGMWRKYALYVGRILKAWVTQDGQHRVAYEVLSGDDKGRSFDATYFPASVWAFDTEEDCRKHFKMEDK